MSDRKPAFLRNLRLSKVALVGDGANQHARISIFKAKEPIAKLKTCPTCNRTEIDDAAQVCPDCGYNFARGATPASSNNAPAPEPTRKEANMPEDNKPESGNEPTLEQRVADLETKLQESADVIKAKDAEIETLKKSIDGKNDQPEDVLKGITDPVVKAEVEKLQKQREEDAERIAKAEEEIRKAREAEADRHEVERVAKFTTHLSIEKDKIGPAFRKLKEVDADAAAAIEQTLTAANEAVETADLFRQVGKTAATPDSAEGKLESLAKSYAVEHNTDVATAMAKVMETEEGAKLYADSLNEAGGR